MLYVQFSMTHVQVGSGFAWLACGALRIQGLTPGPEAYRGRSLANWKTHPPLRPNLSPIPCKAACERRLFFLCAVEVSVLAEKHASTEYIPPERLRITAPIGISIERCPMLS
jgi:hypothetical protein